MLYSSPRSPGHDKLPVVNTDDFGLNPAGPGMRICLMMWGRVGGAKCDILIMDHFMGGILH